MGIFDRLALRQRPPVDAAPRGRSGRAHFRGLVELDELNVDLAGINGLRIFDEMYASDPDIRRLVLMCWSPIQAGTWDVEPYGGEEAGDRDREAAAFVRWALWEAMSPTFPRHLEHLGPVLLRAGFVPFEQLWMSGTWRGRKVVVPRKLDMRLPRTIYNWFQDEYGDLTAIVQQLPAAVPAFIPAQDLVYYRIGAEGDNWMGRSLLRSAYKPWFLKDRLEKIDAIGQERKAVGLPVAYPPTSADDEERESVETILANVHINEAGYIIMPGPSAEWNREDPNAWYLDVVKFDSSSGRGVQDSLRYHRDSIVASFLGDFMRLGHDGVGARALGEVQDDPFLTAVRALASVAVDTINTQLVDRLAALNFDGLDGFPRLTLSLHDEASLSDLATFAATLVEKGVLQADPQLEDYLRERADFPPADKQIREDRQRAAEAAREQLAAGLDHAARDDDEDRDEPSTKPGDRRPDPADDRRAPARTLATAPIDYDKLAWYERMLSLEHLTAALDAARETFEQAGRAQVVAIAQQIARRAAAGKTVPRLDLGPLEDAIAGEIDRLDRLGYDTVIRELRDQHNRLGTLPRRMLDDADQGADTPDEEAALAEERRKRVRRRSRLAAQNVADETRKAIERAALSGAAPGAMTGRDAGRLQQVGERAGRQALRVEGRVNAAGSINGGRAAAARVHDGDIIGAYYTAVLDENTCAYCQIADDGVIRPVDDPILQATMPPNPECDGGDYCRCMLAYVLTDDPAALEYG